MFLDLIAFYRSGRLDSAAKQQEFFGQGGFTGIGVSNNGKCSAPRYFVVIFHSFSGIRWAAKVNRGDENIKMKANHKNPVRPTQIRRVGLTYVKFVK